MEKDYHSYASTIWKVAKAGNISTFIRVFGSLDNDENIEEMLCIYRGNLRLMYTALNAEPKILAHLNNIDLVKELDEQDSRAYSN